MILVIQGQRALTMKTQNSDKAKVIKFFVLSPLKIGNVRSYAVEKHTENFTDVIWFEQIIINSKVLSSKKLSSNNLKFHIQIPCLCFL